VYLLTASFFFRNFFLMTGLSKLKRQHKLSFILTDVVNPDIQSIVEEMGIESKTKSLTRHRKSYTKIAMQWFKEMPIRLMARRLYSTNNKQHQAALAELRTAFRHRYNPPGKPARYWFNWFSEKYPLWTLVTKGNNIDSKVSMVRFRFDHKHVVNNLEPSIVYKLWHEECSIKQANSNKNYVYEELYIDIDNINRYVRRTEQDLVNTTCNGKLLTMQSNLVEAKFLMALAKGYTQAECAEVLKLEDYYNVVLTPIPQMYFECPVFHRRYYTTSLAMQNKHHKLREVCLGPGVHNYDMCVSVYAFYKMLAEIYGIDYSIVSLMIENKVKFRGGIANVLTETFSEAERIMKVKQCLTAMGFGARTETKSSVADIIKNNNDLKAFVSHPDVKAIKLFMHELLTAIREHFKSDCDDLGKDFKHKNGKNNYKKFLAKMYQNYETKIMKQLIKFVDNRPNNAIVLWVHDGIYVRGKLDIMDLQWMASRNNKWIKIDHDKIGYWSDAK